MLKNWLHLCDQRMVKDTVSKRGSLDQPLLRVSNPEGAQGPQPEPAVENLVAQLGELSGPTRVEINHASARAFSNGGSGHRSYKVLNGPDLSGSNSICPDHGSYLRERIRG